MRSLPALLLFAVTTLAAGASLAQVSGVGPYQEPVQPTALTHAGRVLPLGALDVLAVPPIDRNQVALEDQQRALTGLPTRYAIPNVVYADTQRQGTWEQVDDQIMLWRLRVLAPGADHVNVGFPSFFVPAGARLMVYSANYRTILRPFDANDVHEHGELWTPPVQGDDIVIELTIKTIAFKEVKLVLGHVGYGYRFFGAPSIGAEGPCNIDVICPQGNGWRNEIPAIGAISTGGSIFCSGAMLNNTAADRTPYFLTAAHCGIHSGNAASLVVFWNYESTVCGTNNGVPGPFQTGAVHLASYTPSDFTLVRLNAMPAPALGITYAGWDRGGANATSAVGIHHPSGDPKKISFENDPTTTTSYGGTSSPGDGTHVRVIDWDLGTTEPGSSGSPLFNQDHRVIGQLHGGGAACGNNLSDWYGKFSVSWTGGGTSSSRLSNWLDPGNTGATFVNTLGGGGGGPANDECTGAVTVVNGVNGPYSSVGATTSSAWPCASGGNDVWYRYVASCTGMATIRTCGGSTNYDTALQVFSGSCASLTSLGCNDDSCALQSSLTVAVTAGTTYFVRVGGFGGATGTFSLDVACSGTPGNNDECAGSIAIVNGSNGPFDNNAATASAPAWPCGFGTGFDLWYHYDATCTGTVTVDTCGAPTNFDTRLEVFSSCGGASLVCNDDACALQSRVTFQSTSGTRYYVRVSGYNAARGTFGINVACVPSGPANDDCSGAIAVTNGVNGPFDNNGATAGGPIWLCGGSGNNDVWFRYTSICTANVRVDTCSATRSFDTKLEVFSGSCASLTSVGCNDDACGLGSSVDFAATSGTTYTIRVAGFNNQQGNFDLRIKCLGVGTGDECFNAGMLADGTNGPFSTVGATSSLPPFTCGLGGNDLWFTYTATCTGTLEVNTCTPNRGYDTVLRAFSGDCRNLTQVACNDDGGSGCGLGSRIQFPVTQGTTYNVSLGGFNGAMGSTEIVVFYNNGTGSFTNVSPGCGSASLVASGAPNIGGMVSYGMQSTTGTTQLIWLGVTNLGIPLCPGCVFGTDMLVSFPAGLNPVSAPLACDPSFIGASYFMQGADVFTGGGCALPVPFTLTNTIRTTIGG